MIIFSDRELSKRIERSEARFNAAFVESRAKLFPQSGAQWIEVAGAYALFDGPQSPCTQTFALGLFQEATSADLDEIEDFFKKRKVPVSHEISPLAHASLLPLLLERRYQPIEYSTILFLSLKQGFRPAFSLNPDISIRIIEADEVNLWAQTSAIGWAAEMPGIFDFVYELGFISAGCENCYLFLAEINNKPIATSILSIVDGVAICCGTSTIAQARGQGAQTALIRAQLRFAKEKNCEMALMAATPGSQSQKNAEKNGFGIAYTRTKWHLPPTP